MTTLDRLSALEKAASSGPWKHDLGNCEIEGPRPHRYPICDISLDARGLNTADANPINPYADADFIADIRNAAPMLIEIASYAAALLSEEGAFEAVSHFNVAFGLKDALARLENVGAPSPGGVGK